MARYSGRIWENSDRELKLRVEIDIGVEKFKISANESVIGEWPLGEPTVRSVDNTSVQMYLDGEEITIFSRDPDFVPAFVRATRSVAEGSRAASHASAAPHPHVASFAQDAPGPRKETGPFALPVRPVAESGSQPVSGRGFDVERGVHRAETPMLWKW